MAMRQLILNADYALGRYFQLQHDAYIREKLLDRDNGAYTQNEWSKIRTLGYQDSGIDCSELTDNDKYLSRIFQKQYRKLVAAQRLCNVFRFNEVSSVLELGCGEMVQAFVITQLYPHLRYRATDFDPYIISSCSKLSLLTHIEKQILDLSKLKIDDLQGFQTVISWELIYALDKSVICNLFEILGKAKISMIICTSQLTGPLRSILRRCKGIPPSGESTSKNMRMHGWHHSLGFYTYIAKNFDIKLSRIWYPPVRCLNSDNFTFLFFEPSNR